MSERRPLPEEVELAQSTRRLGYWFLAYLLLYPLPWLNRPPDRTALLATAVGMAAFLFVYLRAYGTSDARALWAAAAIALIGFLLQPFGGIWGVFVVYACGMLAYVQPRGTAIRALVVLGCVYIAFGLVLRLQWWDFWPTLFFGAMVAIGSLYSAAFAQKNVELATSREEARRLAVVAERERIARDLHDVLGHTLTVVAIKAELAGKLVERDPTAARREIEEIRATARQSLAELRSALHGMRSATLASELAGARMALDSAGIAHDVRAESGALPPPVETALAYVLRESVTNVVRHSGASRCAIVLAREAGEARLDVRDDGRGYEGREGMGITGMRQRLMPLGGQIEIERSAGTRVIVTVPIEGATA